MTDSSGTLLIKHSDILIVDDQLANLKILARMLKEQKYKVRKATTGFKNSLNYIKYSNIYAKVISRQDDERIFVIHFTNCPREIKEQLNLLYQSFLII